MFFPCAGERLVVETIQANSQLAPQFKWRAGPQCLPADYTYGNSLSRTWAYPTKKCFCVAWLPTAGWV